MQPDDVPDGCPWHNRPADDPVRIVAVDPHQQRDATAGELCESWHLRRLIERELTTAYVRAMDEATRGIVEGDGTGEPMGILAHTEWRGHDLHGGWVDEAQRMRSPIEPLVGYRPDLCPDRPRPGDRVTVRMPADLTLDGGPITFDVPSPLETVMDQFRVRLDNRVPPGTAYVGPAATLDAMLDYPFDTEPITWADMVSHLRRVRELIEQGDYRPSAFVRIEGL